MAINLDDVRRQLEQAGLLLNGEPELDTVKPVRCRVEGGGKEKRGWYRLYSLTLPNGNVLAVGAFGINRGADHGTQKIELPKVERERMTPEQLSAVRARMEAERRAAQAEERRRQERAAAQAATWWAKLSREAGVNAYLARKGLPAGKLYGARLSAQGNLVVPLCDAKGKVWGLQVIYADPAIKAKKGRDKDFTPPGLAKKAHFFLIGMAARGGVILLCEGFATGASLHEATGLPVAVAFDAGNLQPVAQALAAAHKGVRILVCADDDWLQKCLACGAYTTVETDTCVHCGEPHAKANAGVTMGAAAALAVAGACIKPEFPEQRPLDRKGPTDFNDLHTHPAGGLHLVAAQVSAALQAQGWRAAVASAPTHSTEGGGGTFSERQRALAVMPLDELVDRFTPLDDGTGELLYDARARRIAKVKQAVALLPAGARWDDVKRHPVWIHRGAYYLDQVGFDPAGTDPAVQLNTWQGWPMQPRPGSCQRILELLCYLCGEDNGDEVCWWLLRWMAYPLQHPGAKLDSAVIMHGPQGTGKSTVFQCLARIYGAYATVLNQRGLEDKFNADWVDQKLFLLAEEVVTRAEMWHIKNELKELVTGEWVRVNGKHVGAFKQVNRLNIVFLSNEGQPLPIENDDRRHLVVWTPPEREPAYYAAVRDEIDAGGIQALYHHLLQLPLEGWRPHHRPPMTEAKKELIAVSRSSEEAFLAELEAGDLALPLAPCISEDLYLAYTRWCRVNGHKHPGTSARFLNGIGRRKGWEKKRGARILLGTAVAQRTLCIPPLALLEKADYRIGPTETDGQWLARGAEDFAKALEDFGKASRWAA